MNQKERVWTALPKQREFLLSKEDEGLYGGAVGGGKTQALLVAAAMRCMEVPGAHVLYLRRTFPELEISAIKDSHELLTGTGPKYDGGKYRWVFPHKNSIPSVLQFGYLEKDNDVFRYYSAQFDMICFDELTQFSLFQYTYMLARCRTTKKGVKPLIRSATNPGGLGHAWVKARFVDPCQGGKKIYVDSKTGRTRKFIPATLKDNPYLDPGYEARLDELPEGIREALKTGSWDITSGLAFPEFSYDIHVCKSFDPPPWWRRWLSNDPGYTDPFFWHSFAVGPDGKVYLYREITRDSKEPRLTYSEQARLVSDLSTMIDETGEVVPEAYEFKVTGRDAFSRNPEDGKCIVDYYHEGGLYGFLEPPRGDRTDRRFRKMVLHEYLRPYKDPGTGELTAKLQIMDCCEKIIEQLPVLMEDKKDPERVAICAHDHGYDSVGYGLLQWHSVTSAPPGEGEGDIARIKGELAKRIQKRRSRRRFL